MVPFKILHFENWIHIYFLVNRRNDNNYWKLKHVSGGADVQTPFTASGQTISTIFCQLGLMDWVDIFYFIKIYDFFCQEALVIRNQHLSEVRTPTSVYIMQCSYQRS